MIKQVLREFVANFPLMGRGLGLVWRAARPWTIAWGVLLLLQGLAPAALVYLTRIAVDRLMEVHLHGFLHHELLLYHVFKAVFHGIARNLLRRVLFGVAGDVLLKFFCRNGGIIHHGDGIFLFWAAGVTGNSDEQGSEEKTKNKAAYSHATSFQFGYLATTFPLRLCDEMHLTLTTFEKNQ
jgi:hypothetical protein